MPVSTEQQTQPLVRNFLGENRLLPDDLLGDSVSPDAVNTDYSRHTIRKRDGYLKLHSESIKEGGVLINNSNQAKTIWIPHNTNQNAVANWTIEFSVIFNDAPVNGVRVIDKDWVNNTAGWQIVVSASATFVFKMVDGTPSTRNTTSAVEIVPGTKYHVVVIRESGGNIKFVVNGTASSETTVTGQTNTTAPIFIGTRGSATPQNQTINIIVDEIRIWSEDRTNDLARYQNQELDSDALADPALSGYWRLNDSKWNQCDDLSVNRNHGAFDDAGPSFEKGLVPNQSEDGYAIRMDGIDDVAQSAYSAAYAPIFDTGDTWTIESWIRLDSGNIPNSQYIFCMGDFNPSPGAIFTLLINTSKDLLFSHSTTTTDDNVQTDTTYNVVVGQPFHVAIVRNGTSIRVYINSVLVKTLTGVADENGPANDTTHGLSIGALNQDGSLSLHAAFTVDEVRLWTTPRSQKQIEDWYRREYVDSKDSNLVGYWRFDAGDKELDETGNADVSLKADGDKPEWSRGLVYPQNPKRLLLVAPYAQPQRADEVLAGENPFDRELVVATHTDFWSIAGDTVRHLKVFDNPGESSLFDWTTFQKFLILCNGLEPNMKYNGAETPRTVTIAQPAAKPTEALSGSGSGFTGAVGAYRYRYSYRNEKDGTESLASAQSDTATVVAATDTVELSDMTASTNPQVTHKRIYRLDPGSTTYRFLADILDSVTTYSDTGTSIINNDAIDDLRGDALSSRYCTVFQNRLILLNQAGTPSRFLYTEAGTLQIPPINTFDVDEDDGDEITGSDVIAGMLVIFKQYSIHIVAGTAPSNWVVRKVVTGQGCVGGQTIARSAQGLYYLSHDGVYIFNGEVSTYLSLSQQTEFLKADPDKRRFSVGEYDPETHQYVVSLDLAEGGAGSYFDLFPSLFTNYWKLSSDGLDSVGAHDLTGSGTAKEPTFPTDSRFGTIARFDSTDNQKFRNASYFEPDVINFSWGCWFNSSGVNGGGSSESILSVEASDGRITELLRFPEPVVVAFRVIKDVDGAQVQLRAQFMPGTWVHVVGVCRPGFAELYIDGILVDSKPKGDGIWDFTGSPPRFTIGQIEIGAIPYLDGLVRNAFFVDGTALSLGQVKEMYDVEFGPILSRLSFAFDEETQSWAKWNRAFDYLVAAEHSENRSEMLAGSNGFVVRLFSGNSDGSGTIQGGIVPISGSVSSNSSAIITDVSGAFPTLNDGLAGARVLVQSSADDTEQERLIIGNTSTSLFLDRSFSPVITGIYYVAPIKWHWESRWMDMGDPAVVKRWSQIFLFLKESSTMVTLKYKTPEFEDWVSGTFSTTDEFLRKVLSTRGRRLKIRFEHVIPNEAVEIESFQTLFHARGYV